MVIEGVTTRADAKEALIGMLDGINFVDSIKVLRSDCWAQVSVPLCMFPYQPWAFQGVGDPGRYGTSGMSA